MVLLKTICDVLLSTCKLVCVSAAARVVEGWWFVACAAYLSFVRWIDGSRSTPAGFAITNNQLFLVPSF